MGDIAVPDNALYGAQTQRAIANFTIYPQALPQTFIQAIILIKKIAARSNLHLHRLSTTTAEAIINSCDHLLNEPDFMRHFPLGVYQTGSGTSTNMNVNEVLARIASQLSGQTINANDEVNYGQSSNDVIPSAIHLSAALALHHTLLPALTHFIAVTKNKAHGLREFIKTGRTHLMDAMPVSMEQSVATWADQIALIQQQLILLQPALQTLAQGGTAVGTGINTHSNFATLFNQLLSEETGLTFTPAANFFTHISSQDTAVLLSGQLKTLAVALIKIANDLRWMNSGPLAGLSEISLPALQPGSSIMPGKVNPVIPEAVVMACTQVIGNDLSITLAGQSGNFELNVMLPLIANNLLTNITLLSNCLYSLADKAIADFTVNEAKLQEALTRNPILATALNPVIGYEKAAEIAKQAYKENRPIIDVAVEHTNLLREELEDLLDPKKMI
jgi:fumarate hydratase class II